MAHMDCLDEQVLAFLNNISAEWDAQNVPLSDLAEFQRQTVAFFSGICSKLSRRRCKAIEELCETEEAYVKFLRACIAEYGPPVKKAFPEYAPILFRNIEEIVELNDNKILVPLRSVDSSRISAVFKRLGGLVDAYQRYSVRQKLCGELFGMLEECPAFVELEAKVKKGSVLKPPLSLSALLMMPVQRFMRYMNLLREIMAETPREHPDYADLTECECELDGFIRRIDAACLCEEIDGAADLVDVSSQLVGEYRADVDVALSAKNCKVIVLSDQVLFVQRRRVAAQAYLIDSRIEMIDSNGVSLTTGNQTVFALLFKERKKSDAFRRDVAKAAKRLLKLDTETQRRLRARADFCVGTVLPCGKRIDALSDTMSVKELLYMECDADAKDMQLLCNKVVDLQLALFEFPVQIESLLPELKGNKQKVERLRPRIAALEGQLMKIGHLKGRLDKLQEQTYERTRQDAIN